MGEIKLTDVIAPAFYGVHWDIIDGKHTYYDLFGGRGSTKSSFIGTEIPFGMMQDAVNGIHSNAVVFRKVGNTLRESVFEQIAWGIDALGASDAGHTTDRCCPARAPTSPRPASEICEIR